ncbi:hypothetical protein NQZ68_026314 [Dissostichus eleginoides]|nr:hypothetical protein NQZ68_026314 [Dissostichus eleginoides]
MWEIKFLIGDYWEQNTRVQGLSSSPKSLGSTPPPPRNRHPKSSDDEDESASPPSLQANHSILKWYHTQKTRFSKLWEGQPKKKSQKRSGDGLSSGDEEDPILAEEASENDSDRDKFIRRVFGFMKPHVRRHKKDTPASFKDKLALAETSELAGSDDSTMAGSLADEEVHWLPYTETSFQDRNSC